MATNRKELVRGLTYGLIALPLLILGPVLITIGYKAIKINSNYLWLIFGVTLAITAIILIFWGIKIMLNALFNKENE